MSTAQKKEDAVTGEAPYAAISEMEATNRLNAILFDEKYSVANLPGALKRLEDNFRSSQESVKSAGLASLDDPHKIDCLLPWVIRSLNDNSKKIRTQAAGIVGDRFFVLDDSIEDECLEAICDSDDGRVRLAPIRKLVTLLEGMREALFQSESTAMDVSSNPNSPLAQPPLHSPSVPGRDSSDTEIPPSDERERMERIKRYSSSEFTRQLLEHMHKAKKAAIRQSREQPEK